MSSVSARVTSGWTCQRLGLPFMRHFYPRRSRFGRVFVLVASAHLARSPLDCRHPHLGPTHPDQLARGAGAGRAPGRSAGRAEPEVHRAGPAHERGRPGVPRRIAGRARWPGRQRRVGPGRGRPGAPVPEHRRCRLVSRAYRLRRRVRNLLCARPLVPDAAGARAGGLARCSAGACGAGPQAPGARPRRPGPGGAWLQPAGPEEVRAHAADLLVA